MTKGGILRHEKIYVPEAELYLCYTLYVRTAEDERAVFDLEIGASDREGSENCYLWDIGVNRDMADRIWVLFTKGLVTPITAEDILAELLSDADFLYPQA